MAVLDGDANEIVIRVVYDGPPEAGKTTSLRALSSSLAQRAVSPEEGGDGRTLWFDWMEYVGGRYEGCRIRCQIVSVPGQPGLAERRRLLLAGADVVVCVADSTPAAWGRSLAHLTTLQADLAGATPPLGVVLQVNKRDVLDAVCLDDVRALMVGQRAAVGVVESIAADGTGIREAFIYAVRLALDRVRELMIRSELHSGPPDIASADELLAYLRGREAGARAPRVESSEASVAASLLHEVLAVEAAAGRAPPGPPAPGSAPRPPDAAVPSGAIWPPVEGRAILYEVSQQGLMPRQLSSGDWAAGLGSGWRVVSCRDAQYASLDLGRAALIQWARLHALSLAVISPRRCIVVADGGDGWRLWQIVHAEESLRDLLQQALREPSADAAAYRLCQTAQLLLDADRKLSHAPCALTCSIDSVGATDGVAVYIGLMPDAGAVVEPHPEIRASPPALLRMQLGPLVQRDLAERHQGLSSALARVPRRFVHSDTILATLSGLLRPD